MDWYGRVVFGRRVVTDEPTPSPIKANGRTIMWHQTRTLTLDDGSVAYGCAHCEYVRPNMSSIRPHLSKHKDRSSKDAGSGTVVADLIKHFATIEEITADRNRWRDRARKAERSLAKMREALGVGS